jgi:y4mF family transcriptional regulator
MTNIPTFIKYQRKIHGFTQEELAFRAGVGIRFIRDLEKGKMTLQLDKVNQVLSLFGHQISVEVPSIDTYDIYLNYLNKGVIITLKNRIVKYGIIIEDIRNDLSGKIDAWLFVPNNNAIDYLKKKDEKLTEIIINSDIQDIKIQ